MMALSAAELFKALHDDALDSVFSLEGDDPYLQREFKDQLRSRGIEIQFKDLKRKGPQESDEDLSFSTSLFATQSFVWLKSDARPERWAADSKKVFERMVERADGESLFICVQVPPKSKTSKTKVSKLKSYSFEVDPNNLMPWLKRMNQKREAGLGKKELEFLAMQEVDLLTLDSWVELWGLGGETWASLALGWDSSLTQGSQSRARAVNPSFAWVDAILEGRSREAHQQLSRLVEKGTETLPLLGLVSKTLRIWACVERGGYPQGQPPFLVDKVKRALRGRRQGSVSGAVLLDKAAELDLLLKSRPIDPQAALQSLSSLSR